MLEPVAVVAEVRVVRVGDPEPVDARVVDEAEALGEVGREGGDDVAGVAEREGGCVRRSSGRTRQIGLVGIGHPFEGNAPLGRMDLRRVRESGETGGCRRHADFLDPEASGARAGVGQSEGEVLRGSGGDERLAADAGSPFRRPAGNAKSTRVVELGTTVTSCVTGLYVGKRRRRRSSIRRPAKRL